MNEELLKRLDAVAAKMGVAADVLWAALVKQAGVQATTDTVLIGLLWAISALMGWKVRGMWRTVEGYEDKDWASYMTLGAGVFWLLTLGVTCGLTTGVLTGWFNPEYWAFQKLVEMLGSVVK